MEDHVVQQLVAEVMSRLMMTPDEFDHEVTVPRPTYTLSVSGGSKVPEVIVRPIAVDFDGSRHEGNSVVFICSDCNLKQKADPSVGLIEWLRSNPWMAIRRPDDDH